MIFTFIDNTTIDVPDNEVDSFIRSHSKIVIGSDTRYFHTQADHQSYIQSIAPIISVGADLIITQTQFEAIPIQTNQTLAVGLIVRALDGEDWYRLEYTGQTGQAWNIEARKIVLLNFRELDTVHFSGTTVGAQTIDVATFPIPQNIFGKTKIEVFVVDTVSGAFGIAEIIVSWRRFTNGVAIGSTHAIIPLQTPGTLSGASLPPMAIVGNNIVARFTGVAGRTITVYSKFETKIVKF